MCNIFFISRLRSNLFYTSFTEADLGMFGRTGAPTKRGPPQARNCRTNAESHVSTLNSDNSSNIAYSSHVSLHINVRKFMWGRGPTFYRTARARSGLNPAPLFYPYHLYKVTWRHHNSSHLCSLLTALWRYINFVLLLLLHVEYVAPTYNPVCASLLLFESILYSERVSGIIRDLQLN